MNTKYATTITTAIYLLLVILTVVTYQIGESGARSLDISLLVFAIALFKGAVISEYFMQLKWVKGIWRWPILIWLIVLSVVIYTAFTS